MINTPRWAIASCVSRQHIHSNHFSKERHTNMIFFIHTWRHWKCKQIHSSSGWNNNASVLPASLLRHACTCAPQFLFNTPNSVGKTQNMQYKYSTLVKYPHEVISDFWHAKLTCFCIIFSYHGHVNSEKTGLTQQLYFSILFYYHSRWKIQGKRHHHVQYSYFTTALL